MIGLDTNVLVRYLTRDDPAETAAADAAIEQGILEGQKFVISPIVLCELVWVLRAAYGCGRKEIADALEHVLRTAQFHVLDRERMWIAFDDFRRGSGDFSDCCLGLTHAHAGADITLTFDRKLKGNSWVRVLRAQKGR